MTPANIVALTQNLRIIAEPLKKLDPATNTVTPMWYRDSILKSPKGDVVDFLDKEFLKNGPDGNPLNVPVYGEWECFDRAYWAASKLRCNFPGIPVAIATTGLGVVGGKEDIKHAVIYFYTFKENHWIRTCYDPQRGVITDFKPKSAVFFPIFRPNYPGDKNEKTILPPFDSPPFKLNETLSGWTCLYEAEKGYDVSKFDKIRAELKNGAFSPCQPTPDDKYFKREDKTFFLYNQIRGTYRRSAVAFAWGTKRKEKDPKKKDTAVIVLWKDANNYLFWCPDGVGEEIAYGDFDVRFVLG